MALYSQSLVILTSGTLRGLDMSDEDLKDSVFEVHRKVSEELVFDGEKVVFDKDKIGDLLFEVQGSGSVPKAASIAHAAATESLMISLEDAWNQKVELTRALAAALLEVSLLEAQSVKDCEALTCADEAIDAAEETYESKNRRIIELQAEVTELLQTINELEHRAAVAKEDTDRLTVSIDELQERYSSVVNTCFSVVTRAIKSRKKDGPRIALRELHEFLKTK